MQTTINFGLGMCACLGREKIHQNLQWQTFNGKLDKVSSSFCKTAKAKIAFLPFKIGQCFSPKDLVHHAREYVSFFEFLLYMISDPSINVGYKFLKNLYCEEYDQFPGCID